MGILLKRQFLVVGICVVFAILSHQSGKITFSDCACLDRQVFLVRTAEWETAALLIGPALDGRSQSCPVADVLNLLSL